MPAISRLHSATLRKSHNMRKVYVCNNYLVAGVIPNPLKGFACLLDRKFTSEGRKESGVDLGIQAVKLDREASNKVRAI